jgi:hypothetical protein
MIEIIITIGIVFIIIYAIIVTIGMLKGLKKVELYEQVFQEMKEKSNKAYAEMKDIDELGAFEADDEVGDVFDEIKNIVEELDKYITENVNE